MRGLRSIALASTALLCAWAPAGAQTAGKPAPATPAAAKSAPGGGYAQRYAAVCAACHGANGRSEMPGVPALAGQPSFYAITQLYLFREGRRANEAMTAVAKPMTDADLQGFADYIGTLAPVPAKPPAAPPDAARMARGKALAQEHKCVFCHGADFSGGQQVPRIAQQHEDYLQMSLQEYRSGKRVGYTMAMIDAVSRVPPADLDTLAYYISRFEAPRK